MVFFFTEKQQAEGINSNNWASWHFPTWAAYSTFKSPGRPFFPFFWNVKYGYNEHWVFHRRQLDSSSSFWKAHPFIFPCSAGSRVCSAAQTEHPPAQRHPWSSPILKLPLHLHSCWGRAEPWPCHNGVNLDLVRSRVSRQRAAALRGSWLCACHSLTGCQAAGSECPRRGCDKRQAIVPSFPPWLQGSNLLLLRNGNQAPYLIPGTGSWSPRKGSCFVERVPVK